MITGIIIALPEELSSLTSLKISKGQTAFINESVILVCSGAGAKNAENAAELLLSRGAKRLISWGCAAALDETLKPGDLTLANILLAANGESLSVDSEWHNTLLQTLRQFTIHTGLLLESKNIVTSAQEKHVLQQTTNAIVLDMESVAAARVAHNNKIPFIAIRAIADPASMDLPIAVSHALNEHGDIILTKLLMFITQHPLEIPGLIKLGLHFNAAKKTLKSVAKALNYFIAVHPISQAS